MSILPHVRTIRSGKEPDLLLLLKTGAVGISLSTLKTLPGLFVPCSAPRTTSPRRVSRASIKAAVDLLELWGDAIQASGFQRWDAVLKATAEHLQTSFSGSNHPASASEEACGPAGPHRCHRAASLLGTSVRFLRMPVPSQVTPGSLGPLHPFPPRHACCLSRAPRNRQHFLHLEHLERGPSAQCGHGHGHGHREETGPQCLGSLPLH